MVFLIAAIIFAFLMYKFMEEDFLGIAFSAGFVISVTLALGQLGMESLLLRLILAAAAWFILGIIFNELPASSSSTSNSSAEVKKELEALQADILSQQASRTTALNTPSAEVTAIVDETVNIVNEIFEIACIAHFLSDIDYTGMVLVKPYAVRNASNTYCIKIFMHEVSELEQSRQKNIRWKDNPDNHSQNAKIFGFAWKYRNNYNPSRHCYEIDTKTTVRMSKSELPKLEAFIKEQILKRCEMAKYSGDILYHKEIYEINN